MGVLSRFFVKASTGGLGGRKVRMASRLDQYVTQVARSVDPPSTVSYIIDKNYEVVFVSSGSQK
jgi:hypothetical protein